MKFLQIILTVIGWLISLGLLAWSGFWGGLWIWGHYIAPLKGGYSSPDMQSIVVHILPNAVAVLFAIYINPIVFKRISPGKSFWVRTAYLFGFAILALVAPFGAQKTYELSLLSVAQKGDANAQYELADLYREPSLFKNPQLAETWALKSAHQGNNRAQLLMSSIITDKLPIDGPASDPNYQSKMDESNRWVIIAANNGNETAKFHLAEGVLGGCDNTDNGRKAVAILEELAQRNDASAQAALSECYAGGAGVPQDPEKSAQWRRKAVSNGFRY